MARTIMTYRIPVAAAALLAWLAVAPLPAQTVPSADSQPIPSPGTAVPGPTPAPTSAIANPGPLSIAPLSATTPATQPASTTPIVTVTTNPPPLQPTATRSANGRVTNIWVDTDIRQVMQDISSQTDIVIVCDQTVQGVVSMSVKDMAVPDCLERVCAVGGYTYVKIKDYYVIGKADPGTAMFQRVAEPVRVKLAHIFPEQAKTLLQPSLLPYVTFDKASGTVVVTAPEAIRQRVLDAIHLIDQANSQVAIEAIVFELTESGSKDLALDWQFKQGNITGSSQNLINTITYGAGSDLSTYVSLTLHAIVESGKGQVLANPKVMVLNNAEAEIFVGEEKYYTLLSGQASNPYYTLQSIKAGVTLKVCPYIGSNGRITLNLEPEVSDVNDDNTNNQMTPLPGGATVSNPVVTRRHAKTVVDIADGETLVIGGLILDKHRNIIDKVPAAGDIPGLGVAFRKIHQETQRQEVVVLITAHIVDRANGNNEKLTSRLTQRYVTPLDIIAAPAQGKNK